MKLKKEILKSGLFLFAPEIKIPMYLYLVKGNDKEYLLQCKHNKINLNVERFGIRFNTFIHEIALAKKLRKNKRKKIK